MGDISANIGMKAAAVMAGSFLSGGMMSISINVMMDTISDSPQLLKQWARTFYYGIRIFPAISVTTVLLYRYIALNRGVVKRPWGIYVAAGVATFTMVPFTWIFMDPTNKRLFSQGTDLASGHVVELSEVQDLIQKRSWLNITRSLFPLLGAAIGMFATLNHL
ncbi:unnamed protein product [Clonostachys solani]|uniref:Noranthrone monooxygenase n=1 Tax=Clonostachys solani TaxID=160281 RepID=A0A9N9Z974_9HYPO|nr:unnamed protein product [Clonostachys solani]